MPKKTKAIPVERAEWTFGDALYWHFFVHGTRPEGSSEDNIGTLWDPKRAAAAIGVTIRAFWNWIDDRFYPYNTAGVEQALFGSSKLYDDWREELRRLLQQARERRAKPTRVVAPGNVPAIVQAQAVTVYTTPFEASEVDGPLDAADFRAIAPWSAENIGKTSLTSVGSLARRAAPSRRSLIKAMVAGLVLLLGAYGFKRVIDDFKTPPASVALNPSQPMLPAPQANPVPAPQPPKQVGPTLEEQRAAQAKREAEAKQEADAIEAKRHEDQRLAEQKAASDAAARERAKKEADAAEAKRREDERVAAEKTASDAAARERAKKEADDLEAKKREDERIAAEKAASDAAARQRAKKESDALEAKRREDQRLAALEKSALDAAARERAAKESAARELNIKLKALAKSEADDLCQRQLDGLAISGFTLKCDTLIPFGKLLAKAGVSQTASSLGDCAARCRKESDCVAFSFDAGAHAGAASCYLTGSIPAQNVGKNWISGLRN